MNKKILLYAAGALALTLAASFTACKGREETPPPPVTAAPLVSGLPDFTGLVAAATPSVVNISTTRKTTGASRVLPNGAEDLMEEWLRRFFGEAPDSGGPGPRQMPDQNQQSLGSGFIVSTDGDVLTNYHVVAEADEVVVKLSDRRQVTAKVVGADKLSDLALLHIDAKDLPAVKIGDVGALKVGEWVLAIGSPFGFDHSVTAGIVSAKGRSLGTEQYVPFIQTDVAINPGNSGGPLFNLRGEVVGINSQIFSRSGGYMGLSFAIPIDVAMQSVQQLRQHGHVSRGWLGVVVQEVDRALAESFGMNRPEGALVTRVMTNSPAEKAGIAVGDIILEFDGKPVPDSAALPALVGRTPPGKSVELSLLREGKRKTLKVTPGELDEKILAQGEPVIPRAPAEQAALGLSFSDLSPVQRREMKLEQGGALVVGVAEGPAAAAGIRRGDILLRVNGEDIKDAAHLARMLDELPHGKPAAMLVQREGEPRFLALQIPE
ncbi:MAG: DegQ family serine endoprotease [Nevskiales bacterium]